MLLVSAAFLLLFCIVAVIANGTGDSGDSVLHFLYAKHALQYPEFFIHHWAKPVFVLFSCPFAQFGFIGMKIFNCIIAALTGYFSYRTARKLNIKQAGLSVVFLFFSPLYFVLIFSGLTEYLFAFLLILSIYLMIDGKTLSATVLVSFLPFARSEGLIILAVFLVYLLVKRRFRVLPFLITGHLVYGIAGSFFHHDLLWVINKIPYANLGSPYGSGGLFDFFNKLFYVIGAPLYALAVIGFISIILGFFVLKFRNAKQTRAEELLLIYGCFAAFFVAHSLFWWLGIFNSMGLIRVLICIMPLSAIIALNGFGLLTHIHYIKQLIVKKIIMFALLACVVGFPFVSNPAAIQWDSELSLGKDQLLINELVALVEKKFADHKLYYSHPYISIVLDIDHFNPDIHQDIDVAMNEGIPAKSLIIWDDWFSVTERGISHETLMKDDRFERIETYEAQHDSRTIKFVLFRVK